MFPYIRSKRLVSVLKVTYGWGGAARTLAYARKKKKTILAYGECSIP